MDESAQSVRRLSEQLAGAYALYDRGEYESAARLFLQSLELARSFLGSEHPALEKILGNLGAAEQKMGNHRRALQYYQEALTLLGGEAAEDQAAVAGCLHNLGTVHLDLGEYDEAERYLDRAREMWQRNPQWEDGQAAATLHTLGSLCSARGEYEKAETHYRQALTVWEERPDRRPLDFGRCMADLAAIYQFRGEYSRAEPLYRKALEVARRDLGERHPDFASILNSQGLLHAQWGEDDRAVTELAKALDIRSNTLGADHPDTANSLNSLGSVLLETGRLQEARALLTSALSARRNASTPDLSGIAHTLNNLALVCELSGDYVKAARLLSESLELRRRSFGPTHPEVARCQVHLGSSRAREGKYGEAEPLLVEALASYRRVWGEYHPEVVEAMGSLAAVFAATGRPKESLELMQHAMSTTDWLMRDVFSAGSEAQRMGYLERARGHTSFFLSLVWRHFPSDAAVVRLAMGAVMRRKGLGLETLATQRDALLSKRYEHLRPRIREMAGIRMTIARTMLAGQGTPGAPPRKELLDESVARLRDLEADLAAQIPEMRLDKRLQEANCGSVAGILPPKSAIVEFVRFDVFDFEAKHACGGSPVLPSRYLAFILRSGDPATVALVDLGEAAQVEEMVHSFRAWVTGKTYDARDLGVQPGDRSVSSSNKCATQLRARIFDPVRDRLAGTKRLFIAPDGDLNLLPFEALPKEGGGYLIDDYVISYLASGRDVLRLNDPIHGTPAPPLVIADPDFDLRDPSVPTPRGGAQASESSKHSRDMVRGGLRFQPLANIRREGERVAEMLGVKARTGGNALEAPLKSCASPRILHIATHGFFLADQDAHPGGGLHPASLEDESGPRFTSRLENPLLRSGLALAGANTFLGGGALPADAEDGLLTAEDVSVMELVATELVVLSACETGLGQVRVGEGVFGLRRAFELAGARTLVMSLWKVPDAHTRELMEEFYRLVMGGCPRAEALRTAQLSVKARYPDPFNWGAFICQGQPWQLAS